KQGRSGERDERHQLGKAQGPAAGRIAGLAGEMAEAAAEDEGGEAERQDQGADGLAPGPVVGVALGVEMDGHQTGGAGEEDPDAKAQQDGRYAEGGHIEGRGGSGW